MSRIIRLKEVIKITGLSRSSILSFAKEGSFPKPFKIGVKAMGWLESDIDNWIEDRSKINAN